ncbi:MAG: GTPase [Thermotogota bacterium]|nr:GTPase [Thermotogota bacterium]MDK2864074.1 GTPase [Thermotogota bacterium]HCZ06126.1 GTPase HflX [Thermotogota bacterium]
MRELQITDKAKVIAVLTTRDDYAKEELERLVETAGGEVVDVLFFTRKPDPSTYLGKGKLEKLKALVDAYEAELVVFDTELTPSQQRNLQDFLDVRVIDRSELILDIFAIHAATREAKLQVELAQLQYELPRLVGAGKVLSRLGGGIGTRGPGETKLETDRRRILRRISQLKKELKEVEIERQIQRKNRIENRVPVVAIAGYTNSGKSTLLKSLSDADVFAANQLFATVSPKSAKVKLLSGREAVFIDTVGFIERLPHQLVESFKSTLEEIVYSDLVIVLGDLSDIRRLKRQLKTVEQVLAEIGADEIPRLLVLNKVDLLDPADIGIVLREFPTAVLISAKRGIGITSLLKHVERALEEKENLYELSIPWDRWGVFASYRDHVTVISEQYEENLIKVKFICSQELYSKLLSLKLEGER